MAVELTPHDIATLMSSPRLMTASGLLDKYMSHFVKSLRLVGACADFPSSMRRWERNIRDRAGALEEELTNGYDSESTLVRKWVDIAVAQIKNRINDATRMSDAESLLKWVDQIDVSSFDDPEKRSGIVTAITTALVVGIQQ